LYLDRLPNRKNVKKIAVAIGYEDFVHYSKVYYIHPDRVQELGLNYWLRGVNTVGYIHPTTKDRGFENEVISEDIKVVPLKDIIMEHNVTELDLLKIDTEGSDCKILLHFLPFAKEANIKPKRIIFEHNSLTDPTELQLVNNMLESLGYKYTEQVWDEITYALEKVNG
jgi:FkbM family methyltransferase